MGFALVQDTGRGSGSPLTRKLAATPTAGNVLIIPITGAANGNSVNYTISDDSGGLITWRTAVTSAASNFARTKIFYAYNIPALAANPTITIAKDSGTATVQGNLMEWSGFGVNDPLSVVKANSSGGAAFQPAVTGNTPTATGEIDALCIAVVVQVFNAGITIESVTPPWTQLWEGTGGDHGEADYKIITTGGIQHATWTLTGGADIWSASIACFCLNNTPTAGVRDNQVVQTLLVKQPSATLHTNQVVESVVAQNVPVLHLNQVVLTILVITPSSGPPVVPATGCDANVDVGPVMPPPGCDDDISG